MNSYPPQDLEYFGILYNESVSNLLSYCHDNPSPYHWEQDSDNDTVNYGALSSSFATRQGTFSDHLVETTFVNLSSQSNKSYSYNTSEKATPSTEPSAFASPCGVDYNEIAVQPRLATTKTPSSGFQVREFASSGVIYSDGPRLPVEKLTGTDDAITCLQCHKVFPTNSVLK